MSPHFSTLCLIVLPFAALVTRAADAPKRPNIVFILADDLGWSDTTLYGTTKFYETPNLDRLAARGIKFTNAYAAAPVCSPTRASILTGLYPGRLGITTPSGHVPEEKLEASWRVDAARRLEADPLLPRCRRPSRSLRLYNLRADLGETKNLAAEFPERVREVDALIDTHLRETHAIVPGKNPIYSALVPDWTPSKDATVTVRDNTLVITSSGTNPSLATRDLPHARGPYTVEFRILP